MSENESLLFQSFATVKRDVDVVVAAIDTWVW